MEKQVKSSKNKLIRFLTFQNVLFIPTKVRSSGKIIPFEGRLRSNKSLVQEPTSPKISCMGQIRHNKQVAKQDKLKKLEQKLSKGSHMALEKAVVRKSDDCWPCLGQMRRFASARELIKSFEWTARFFPVDGDEDEKFPSTAPIVVNGIVLEPRKEINLWKRRTMAKPRPLRI